MLTTLIAALPLLCVQETLTSLPPDPIPPQVRGTWEGFLASGSGRLLATFDPTRGTLRSARGALRIAPGGIRAANAGAAARLTAARLAPALGIPAEDLTQKGLAASPGGLFHAFLERTYRGIPVEGAGLHLRFSAAGDLLSLEAAGLSRSFELDPGEAIPLADAAELARLALPGAQAEPDRPRLWVDPTGGGRLIFKVVVEDPSLSPSTQEVRLDALTGEVLDISPTVAGGDVSGKVSGFSTPAGPMETAAEMELPLPDLRVRAVDSSAAWIQLSSDGGATEAVISTDGSRVFWTSDADGDRDIWTALADGSAPLKLVDDGAEQYDLATDASGTTLWFTSEASGDPELWSIDADGSGLTRLTTSPGIDRGVSVSADGSLWVWESDRDGDFEIYGSSGAGTVQLTSNTSYDAQAVLCGDGSTIAFVRGTDPSDAKLWAMAADGSGALQLVFGAGSCAAPSITSDGLAVLFERRRAARPQLFSGGPLGGAGLGYSLETPTIWAATTDGAYRGPVDDSAGAYQIDPALAGDGAFAAWSERNSDGSFDIVHVELATGARLRFPLGGDQIGVTLDDGGRAGAWIDSDAWSFDLDAPGASAELSTDSAGLYSTSAFADNASVSIEAALRGTHVRVEERFPGSQDLRASLGVTAPTTGADIVFGPVASDPLETPQVTAYSRHSAVHDYLEAIYTGILGYPTPLPFDGQLRTRVNDPAGTRNAHYNYVRNRTHFFVGRGTTAPNTCYDTVVYHEYGHSVDEWFGRASALGGLVRPGHPIEHAKATSEGLGDVVALLTSGSSVIGEDWKGPGTALRDYGVIDRQYDCLDCKTKSDPDNGGAARFEPHAHGEALAAFAHDLVATIPTADAETLLLDALGLHPANMNAVVETTFDVDLVRFGGAHFDDLCRAARRHGFDCPPRPDWGSAGCTFSTWCGSMDPFHRDTGLESLGFMVDSETGCQLPDGDEDGLDLPTDTFTGGTTTTVPLTVSVDAALLGSGRYGGTTLAGTPNPLHYIYVNAWLLVDRAGTLEVTHILGTGSGAPGTGVSGFAADTFAIDPDSAWGGLTFHTYAISVDWPDVSAPFAAVLRVRLDYGEDGGRSDLKALSPLNDPGYFGDCGPSRSGEVEDYQVLIVPGS